MVIVVEWQVKPLKDFRLGFVHFVLDTTNQEEFVLVLSTFHNWVLFLIAHATNIEIEAAQPIAKCRVCRSQTIVKFLVAFAVETIYKDIGDLELREPYK